MGDTSSELQQTVQALTAQLNAIMHQLQAGQEHDERMQTQLQDARVTAQQAAQAAQEANARAQAAHVLAQDRQAEPAAPHRLSGSHSLKPKRPEEFDPAKKKDVDTWLFQVEVYYQLHPHLTDLVKIVDCSSHFRGAAQTWWRHYASSHNLDALTWVEFRAAIQARWQLVNTVRTARDKIANIRQLTSVQDFTQRFLDLKVQIPAMTEEEAIDKYVRGLKPGIRRDLEQLMAREGDKSLEELIRFADRTDSIDFQARRYRPAGPTPMELGALEDQEELEDYLYDNEYLPEDDEEGFSDDPQLAAVRTQRRAKVKGKRPMRRISPEEIARRRDQNLCYNCGEAGHQSRICPQRRRPQKSGRRPVRQLNTIELCALGSIYTAPARTATRRLHQTTSEGSKTVHGRTRTLHGVPNTVRGNINSVHGSPNSVRGKLHSADGSRTTVHGNPNSVHGSRTSVRGCPPSVRGQQGDARENAPREPLPSSTGLRTSRSGAKHRKATLESTHRVTASTKGLPRAYSREAPVPSPLVPDSPEVTLAGMGVDPLKLTGLVEGKPVTVMIDSGSAGNFISREAAKRLGMAKLPYTSNVNVRLADGSKLPLTWRTPQFRFQLGDHQEQLHLLGLPLQGHEIILGRPWLRQWNPHIDWSNDAINFPERRRQGARVTPAPAPVAREPIEGRLISALQVKRATKRGEVRSFLAIITPCSRRRRSLLARAPVLCGCC